MTIHSAHCIKGLQYFNTIYWQDEIFFGNWYLFRKDLNWHKKTCNLIIAG